MIIDESRFFKGFFKSRRPIVGKIYESVRNVINQVIDAQTLEEIPHCRKIEGLHNIYRIRIGSKRAFFVLKIEIEGDIVKFEYLVSRGEAYAKKNMDRLRKKDI